MMADRATSQRVLPLAGLCAAVVALVGTAYLVSPGSRFFHRDGWTRLNAPAASTMHFDPDCADPLNGTAIIRGVPTQRSTAPDSGFSQSGEDLLAWKQYLYGMRGGVFLEMGALDGYTYSNTLLFEAFLGWTGVLIEPGVKSFERLTVNRPNATKVNAAVCDSEGVVHFIEGVGVGEIDGIVEFMADSYKAHFHSDEAHERHIEVRCMPLKQLLKEKGLKHVNFFSLDVEGAELAVLKTIDFKAVTFDVIVMETSGHDPAKDAACVELLKNHGYKDDQAVSSSTWFLRDGFEPSRQPEQ